MKVLTVLRTAALIAASLIVIAVLLSVMDYPMPSHPLVILFVLIPTGLLFLGMALVPVRIAPVSRFIAAVVVFALYVLLRGALTPRNWWTQMQTRDVATGAPFDTLATVSLVIALIWLAGQMLLVVLSDRVRAGKGSPTAVSLVNGGYMGLLRASSRGEFGTACARLLTGMRWGALILAGVWLLYRSGSLHQPEEDLLLPLGRVGEATGPSRSVLVSLTTPDNNPLEYIRTAIEINALFRAGGAAVVCFPRSGMADSTIRLLIDSLESAGAVVYDREQFDPRYAWGGTGWQFLRFWSAGFGWSNSLPMIHPSIRAASRYLNVPVRLPADTRRMPAIPWAGNAGVVDPAAGDVMLGPAPVPRWSDGWSVVPRPQGLFPTQHPGGDTLWNSFLFRVGILRYAWEMPIEYMFYGDAHRVRTLPDSILRLVAGRMVFIDWSDMGGGMPRFAAGPAMIADMLVRGLFVREALSWHIPVTVAVLLCGIALFVWSRPSVMVLVLVAVALMIATMDVWVFREYLLVTRLVYPAFVALVSAVVFPLVRISERG